MAFRSYCIVKARYDRPANLFLAAALELGSTQNVVDVVADLVVENHQLVGGVTLATKPNIIPTIRTSYVMVTINSALVIAQVSLQLNT